MRYLPLLLSLWLPFAAQAATPVSGVYDGTLIAIDPTSRQLSGYMNTQTGMGQFTCIYYFSGILKNDQTEISASYPGDRRAKLANIRGKAVLANNAVQLHMEDQLVSSNACGPGDAGSDHPTYTLQLDQAFSAWRSIRVVEADKAHFYGEPQEASRNKAYLVRDDGVGVLEDRGEWLHVQFYGSKSVEGWMKASDFYPID